MLKKIFKKQGFWSYDGPKMDTVLSTRARLARNLKSLPFPIKMEDKDFLVTKKIASKFIETAGIKDISIIDLNDMLPNEKRLLRERNLITHDMENSPGSLLVTDSENNFMILINTEDHFHIQVIKSGFQPSEAYAEADSIDDSLNSVADYAFSSDFGYLTADPGNLGTGLKMSVMLHLPALSLKSKMQFITDRFKSSGIDMKSVIEEKHPVSAIYQLSNSFSLGVSEAEIIEMVSTFVNKIVELEDYERDNFISSNRNELEDTVGRSYGILKYCRKISYSEAMEHLSNIRLGVILALIKNINMTSLSDMMVKIQLSHLQHEHGRMFVNTEESDTFRSQYIRKLII